MKVGPGRHADYLENNPKIKDSHPYGGNGQEPVLIYFLLDAGSFYLVKDEDDRKVIRLS